jgi:hypothetical protein
MRRPRGRAKLASVLVVCAVAVGGVVAALVVGRGHESAADAPTTGEWAPITVSRPKLPVIGGGIPVDIDPMVHRSDLSATLAPLPGTHRYRITISNVSNLGAINSFQWYPPAAVHIVKLIGNSEGNCTLTGLTGFGGNQFPTLVLYPDVFCDNVDLKPPSCTCLGDGGTMTISFVTEEDYGGGAGEFRMHTATLVRDRIPSYLKPGSTAPSSG